jgi:hypothetical protein
MCGKNTLTHIKIHVHTFKLKQIQMIYLFTILKLNLKYFQYIDFDELC